VLACAVITQERAAPMDLWLEHATQLGHAIAQGRGDVREAQQWHMRVLDSTAKTYGPEHPRAIQPLSDVASMAWAMSDSGRAHDLMFSAFRLAKQHQAQLGGGGQQLVRRLQSQLQCIKRGEPYRSVIASW
jgi:hypothetical protein